VLTPASTRLTLFCLCVHALTSLAPSQATVRKEHDNMMALSNAMARAALARPVAFKVSSEERGLRLSTWMPLKRLMGSQCLFGASC